MLVQVLNSILTPRALALLLLMYLGAPQSAHADTGLDFPSNGDSPSAAFVAFQFLNPQNNGMPIWGPSNRGVTYIWKYRPRQQAGYYVTFWWSNNGQFLWKGGNSGSYYGAHPYPQGGGSGTTTHNWELAGMATGADYQNTLSGSPLTVVKDVWYTQALRIVPNGNGTYTGRFYVNLPSLANSNIIQSDPSPAGFGDTNPPSPAITFGDSPWYADFGHERMSGVVRHIKIFNNLLTEADTLSEAASDSLVTTAGQANIWYMNIDPTPTDITDKSGAGHNPTWASSARPALFTDSSSAVVPNPPTNVTVE